MGLNCGRVCWRWIAALVLCGSPVAFPVVAHARPWPTEVGPDPIDFGGSDATVIVNDENGTPRQFWVTETYVDWGNGGANRWMISVDAGHGEHNGTSWVFRVLRGRYVTLEDTGATTFHGRIRFYKRYTSQFPASTAGSTSGFWTFWTFSQMCAWWDAGMPAYIDVFWDIAEGKWRVCASPDGWPDHPYTPSLVNAQQLNTSGTVGWFGNTFFNEISGQPYEWRARVYNASVVNVSAVELLPLCGDGGPGEPPYVPGPLPDPGGNPLISPLVSALPSTLMPGYEGGVEYVDPEEPDFDDVSTPLGEAIDRWSERLGFMGVYDTVTVGVSPTLAIWSWEFTVPHVGSVPVTINLEQWREDLSLFRIGLSVVVGTWCLFAVMRSLRGL